MGRVCLSSLLVSTVSAVLVLASPASAYTPGTSSDFFGVNGAYLRDFTSPAKAATLDGLATSMSQQGISWTRLTFDQAVEERQRGMFNWYVPDTMVAALARHGVRGAASFVGTAAWEADPSLGGSCGTRAAPYDQPGWTSWVAAAAARYGEHGTFWTAHPELPRLPIHVWEIGNEVNASGFWCPATNPEQYAQIYSASASAITAIDPTAQVIIAGLRGQFGSSANGNMEVGTFLTRMVAADPSLRDTVPAVAIHPYASTADGVLGVVARFRRAMRSAGMGNTPMLVNETGWYTSGASGPLLVSEEQRADLLGDIAGRLWRTDCGISGLAPYSWITLQQDPSNSEQWYGLTDSSTGAPNLGGLAYGQQIRLALGDTADPPPQDTLRVCGSKLLTVQRTGSGRVTSSLAGLDCGTSCIAGFDDSTQLTLTATASPGYEFRGWTGCASSSGSQCSVSMTADRTVTANFVAQQTATEQSPPNTWITKSRVNRRTGVAAFAFGGGQGTGELTFACRVDRRPAAPCSGLVNYRLRPGRHAFRVVSTDELGRTDPTPATRTFTVRR